MDGVVKRRFGPDIRASFAFIMIAFVLGIPLVHALIRVWGNMVLMIDNLRLTLPILTILLKFVIMRRKQSGMSGLNVEYVDIYLISLSNSITAFNLLVTY